MAVPSFPLLQLPSETIIKILKSMDAIDQIAISLVSMATKTLITALNLKNTDWYIDIGNTLNLFIYIPRTVFTWHFEHDDPETNQPVQVVKEDGMTYWRRTMYDWKKEGFGIKNWIDHLLKITNTSNINYISFYAAGERFSMDFVKDIIKGLNIIELSIQPECSDAYSQSILNSVKTRMLSMDHTPYQNKELFQKHLMENFEVINFAMGPSFTLNDLLAMNSSTIDIRTPQNITIKTLNQFIKCWKTGSNRQLKFMAIGIRFDVVPNIDDIFRGIKYKKHPEHQTREFEVPESSYNVGRYMAKVNGGYDICAFDGRKATFLVQMQILMFVWPF